MKTGIFISVILLSGLSCFTQNIANSDFENWVTLPNTFGGMDPVDWKSTNSATAGGNIKAITRSTDKHSGTYALALSPLISLSATDTLTSAIVLGQAPLNFTSYKLDYEKGGKPFTKMIASVNGYYKFSKSSPSFDSAYAIVTIKDAITSGYLGIGKYGFSPATIYTPFQIDITPLVGFGGPPDSLMIAFFYKSNNQNQLPAKLLIDSIFYKEFVNTTGITEDQYSGFTLFPNPSRESIHMDLGIPGDHKIEILSSTGQILQEHYLKNTSGCELTLPALKGIYFIRCTLQQSGRQYTRKVVHE